MISGSVIFRFGGRRLKSEVKADRRAGSVILSLEVSNLWEHTENCQPSSKTFVSQLSRKSRIRLDWDERKRRMDTFDVSGEDGPRRSPGRLHEMKFFRRS